MNQISLLSSSRFHYPVNPFARLTVTVETRWQRDASARDTRTAFDAECQLECQLDDSLGAMPSRQIFRESDPIVGEERS